MLSVADDFLSAMELEYHRTVLTSKVDASTLKKFGMWMHSHEIESGQLNDIHYKLGVIWKITAEKTQNYFKDVLGVDVVPYSFRYQCTNSGYTIHPHKDGSVRNKSIDNCYSSIVYLNDEWDESLGGNFEVDTRSVSSLPNRMVIYSRDEEHWVSKALQDWKIPRMLLLISCSKKDED